MAAFRLRMTFAAMALSGSRVQAVNGSGEVAQTDGLQALNESITFESANASAPSVAEFFNGLPSLLDTWGECDTKCGVLEYIKAKQAQMPDFQAQDVASQVGEMTERAFEAGFDMTCRFRDVLKCVANNRDICSPQVPGDGMVNVIVNSAFDQIDLLADADEADCLCDSCPGIKRAMARYHGVVAEAAAEHFLAGNPLDELPGQLQSAVYEGICPMFGALSCMEFQPTCQRLSDAIQQGQEAFNRWAPKYLVEEAEQTKASCVAAGVSMALEQTDAGFLSGSAPSSAMVALSLVLIFIVVRC